MTIIRNSKIMLGKLKRLGMELIQYYRERKNLLQRQNLVIGDTVITDLHELSNAFNRHFSDIGPNLAAKINSSRASFRDFVESCDSTFELELPTIDGLRKLVTDLWARLMALMVFQLAS